MPLQVDLSDGPSSAIGSATGSVVVVVVVLVGRVDVVAIEAGANTAMACAQRFGLLWLQPTLVLCDDAFLVDVAVDAEAHKASQRSTCPA